MGRKFTIVKTSIWEEVQPHGFTWAMNKTWLLFRVYRGWNPTQFINHCKDPRIPIKQPGFHGKYPFWKVRCFSEPITPDSFCHRVRWQYVDGFNYFLEFSHPSLGNMNPLLTYAYFSDGLVQLNHQPRNHHSPNVRHWRTQPRQTCIPSARWMRTTRSVALFFWKKTWENVRKLRGA